MALTLKAWRKARDLSQAQMAERLDVHTNTYRNWEESPEKIEIGRCIQICRVLNVKLDDIIFLPDYSTSVE